VQLFLVSEHDMHGERHETQVLFCKKRLVSKHERHTVYVTQFPQGGRQGEQTPEEEFP